MNLTVLIDCNASPSPIPQACCCVQREKVRACVRACASACVCACVRACECVDPAKEKEKEISSRSSGDSNPQPFDHESGALATELSPVPV